MYALGNNSYGQCGRQIIENEDYSKLRNVNNITLDSDISKIVCGQDHRYYIHYYKLFNLVIIIVFYLSDYKIDLIV